MLTEQEVLSRFESPRKCGKEWRTRCPVHGDKNPSLTIARGDKKWLFNCRSQGCSERDILKTVGLKQSDVYHSDRPTYCSAKSIVHDYENEKRTLLFQVVRTGTGERKKIRQRRPDPANPGRFIWNLDGVRRVLYKLPELIAASASDMVYIVEGERNVDDVRKLGLVSTTNPFGAGKWRSEFNTFLKDRHVVILPDNNKPGREHAADVANQLHGVAGTVKLVTLPNLPEGGDVSDWLQAGGSRAELERLVAEAGPAPTPTRSASVEKHEGGEDSTREGGAPKPNQAQRLIELARERAEFFRSDEDDEAYVSFLKGGCRMTCAVTSRLFRAFLVEVYVSEFGGPPAMQNVSEAASMLDTMSVFGSSTITVALRVGEVAGRIYLDLGDSTWRMVEVAAEGWTIKESAAAPIRFRRSRTTRALPAPIDGGSIDELRAFVNCETEDDFRLMIAYLLFCLQPHGPFPLLGIQGEPGSAKSTTTRILRRLVDPSQYPLLRFSGRPDDFFSFAKHSWFLAFDNLSVLSRDASDALCGVSTGTGDARRKLYTDDELHGFNGFRPVVLNGIDDIATRADLASRTLTVKLPAIDPSRRREESDFWRAFQTAEPRILGALLTALSATLRELPSVRFQQSSRMADFSRWGLAVEKALLWPQGAFGRAYQANQRRTEESAVEADAVASTIEGQLLERWENRWEGSMQDLLRDLNGIVGGGSRDRSWPSSPRHLASRLERLKPLFRPRGIEVYRGQRTKNLRPWVIERRPGHEEWGPETVTTVTASPGQSSRALAGDNDGDHPRGEGDGDDGGDDGAQCCPETVTGGLPSPGDAGDDGDGLLPLSETEEEEEWAIPAAPESGCGDGKEGG